MGNLRYALVLGIAFAITSCFNRESNGVFIPDDSHEPPESSSGEDCPWVNNMSECMKDCLGSCVCWHSGKKYLKNCMWEDESECTYKCRTQDQGQNPGSI